jgi:septum formation protein
MPGPIVLASRSPRRARILRELGVDFEVSVADVDEALLPGESGHAAAERLARAKAERVAASTRRPVLAADTLVLSSGTVLGKPETAEDARRMLRMLSGRTHEVVTGVCLVHRGVTRSGLERTDVTFLAMTEAEIRWYVATGEPSDKAGAYNVGGLGALFVERVTGSPSNVEGLPVTLAQRLAREAGLSLGPP